MSGKLAGQVWELVLDRGKRDILLALADHAYDDGTNVFPSIAYLAWKTDYSERQVQRVLRALETDRLIIPVAHRLGGRGHATEYEIHLENGIKKKPYDRRKGDAQASPIIKGDIPERVTFNDVKGDIFDVKGDIFDVKGDTQMSPQPINHKKETKEEPLVLAADAAAPSKPVKSVSPSRAKTPIKTTRAPGNGKTPRTAEEHALCEELVDGLSEVSGMLRQTNRAALYDGGWQLVGLLAAGIQPSKAHIVKAFGLVDPGPGAWWWYRDDQRVKMDLAKGLAAPMPKPRQVVEMYTVSLRPLPTIAGNGNGQARASPVRGNKTAAAVEEYLRDLEQAQDGGPQILDAHGRVIYG